MNIIPPSLYAAANTSLIQHVGQTWGLCQYEIAQLETLFRGRQATEDTIMDEYLIPRSMTGTFNALSDNTTTPAIM